MKKLTDKQQAFVNGKAAGMKNREAAIAAGYAPSAAGVQAAQMMGLAHIKSAIAEKKKAMREMASAVGVEVPGDEDAPKLVMPKSNYDDSLEFLRDAMNLKALPIPVRAEYAKALLPYQHARIAEKGKKESAKDRAKEIAGGERPSRFQTKAPPVLRAVK